MYYDEHDSHSSPVTGSLQNLGIIGALPGALACALAGALVVACSGTSTRGDTTGPGPGHGERATATDSGPADAASISSPVIFVRLDSSHKLEYKFPEGGAFQDWPDSGALSDLLPTGVDWVLLLVDAAGQVGCDVDATTGAQKQWRRGTRRTFALQDNNDPLTKQFTVCKGACTVDAGSPDCVDPILIIDRKGSESP